MKYAEVLDWIRSIPTPTELRTIAAGPAPERRHRNCRCVELQARETMTIELAPATFGVDCALSGGEVLFRGSPDAVRQMVVALLTSFGEG